MLAKYLKGGPPITLLVQTAVFLPRAALRELPVTDGRAEHSFGPKERHSAVFQDCRNATERAKKALPWMTQRRLSTDFLGSSVAL